MNWYKSPENYKVGCYLNRDKDGILTPNIMIIQRVLKHSQKLIECGDYYTAVDLLDDVEIALRELIKQRDMI